VNDPQSLKDAVWAREQTRTTGIGHGLAIPHGKCEGLSGLAMASFCQLQRNLISNAGAARPQYHQNSGSSSR
ncbi:MAG: PTS transporter subunit EIIA, partial [Leptolyngbya sp. SIO4C5]|nr:PTS transporter subunit EIIA [Leptolyngbya sp. SIO4C5]